jgi:hypothetical protein
VPITLLLSSAFPRALVAYGHRDLRRDANLTMRMSMRRFTHLTNAFSKKLENQAAMVSLYFMYYNFAEVHQTLRVTPAMEAGIADHVWAIEEIVARLG